MRGITKGPAPANVARPNRRARTLAQADADYQVRRATTTKTPQQHARDSFNRLYKRALRADLFAEQGNLCIYCERTVEEPAPAGPEPPPIDHWMPLNLYLNDVFNWNNLHVSCDTIDTCDGRKEGRDIGLPLPCGFKYEDVFGFTSGGRMYVRADVTIGPQLRQALAVALDDQPGPPSIRSTLNLNQPALREARAAAIEAEEAFVEGQPPTPAAQRQQHARALLSQTRRDDFISARVAYLQGQLGVGR